VKLSDYVIDHLARLGVTHVFGMSGGAAVHLLDSVSHHPDIEYVCSQHEQSAAISADGYARTTGLLGVAITTSGPGATNLLTGVCCSYYDSVATLMLTGQVATHRLKGNRAVRQVGFQETDVISIFSSVTKYAYQITDANEIRYHLEKAVHLANEGRPGPVLLAIPDDLQRADIDPDQLRGFVPPDRPATIVDGEIEELMKRLRRSERPVLIVGGGLSTPRIDKELNGLVERLGIPVLVTWAGSDLLPSSHPLRVGSFGVYGPRLGNYVVQNADLLLVLGSRLSQNLTGGVLSAFARNAYIVMVDTCAGEMDKFDGRGIEIDLRIRANLTEFVPQLTAAVADEETYCIEPWMVQIECWRQELPDDRPVSVPADVGYVDAYAVIDSLSDVVPENEIVFVDTGGNLTWTCNGFRVKQGQRLISAWNNTPMGYSLPAAIGAATANPSRMITCIIGDGGLMLCLSELVTVKQRDLPIRILLFNNHGHGIQKQTLETWLEGNYVGVDTASGLAFPDFPRLAMALDLDVVTINSTGDIREQLTDLYIHRAPIFCNIEINPDQKLYPFLKFGMALENQFPPMDQTKSRSLMLVDPYVAENESGLLGTPGI